MEITEIEYWLQIETLINMAFALLCGVAAYLFWSVFVEPSTKRGERRRQARHEFAAVIRLGGTRKDAMMVYRKILKGESAENGWKEIGRLR